MRCLTCDIDLDTNDNYCRNCGAPVRVLGMTPVQSRATVVRVGPSPPALLTGAARPLATGAAAVAAGALVRFVARRAMRGIIGEAAAPRSLPVSRAVTPSDAPARRTGRLEVTEVYWYRRISRP